MREVDFLPPWYAGVRRQRAWLRVQTWSTASLVACGLIAIAIVHGRATQAARALDVTRDHAEQAGRSVRELDETLTLQRQLVAKQRVLGDVGLPVEASRVIGELAQAAPREVCFDGIEMRTDEQAIQRTIADRARDPDGPAVTRCLNVRLTGAAPTEEAITSLYTQLIARPFVADTRIVNSDERLEDGHTMRTFEITFSISLDIVTEGGKR